jgi:hypothetical protein
MQTTLTYLAPHGTNVANRDLVIAMSILLVYLGANANG